MKSKTFDEFGFFRGRGTLLLSDASSKGQRARVCVRESGEMSDLRVIGFRFLSLCGAARDL